MNKEQKIKDLIDNYKKRNHIYDEKVDLDEHCINIINEYLNKYFITCSECVFKYPKEFNYYCPHMVGPVFINGYCDKGKKKLKSRLKGYGIL